jgi:hypothetical protein
MRNVQIYSSYTVQNGTDLHIIQDCRHLSFCPTIRTRCIRSSNNNHVSCLISSDFILLWNPSKSSSWSCSTTAEQGKILIGNVPGGGGVIAHKNSSDRRQSSMSGEEKVDVCKDFAQHQQQWGLIGVQMHARTHKHATANTRTHSDRDADAVDGMVHQPSTISTYNDDEKKQLKKSTRKSVL